MKIIGKWSKSKGNIKVNIPGIRTVGNKKYPYISEYLGDEDNPFSTIDIEKDIYAEYKLKVKLMPKSSRGGDIVEV